MTVPRRERRSFGVLFVFLLKDDWLLGCIMAELFVRGTILRCRHRLRCFELPLLRQGIFFSSTFCQFAVLFNQVEPIEARGLRSPTFGSLFAVLMEIMSRSRLNLCHDNHIVKMSTTKLFLRHLLRRTRLRTNFVPVK